jgi:hypothetical protein
MTTEYILFDPALRDRFVAFAAERGVACGVRPDRIEGFVVELPDHLAADIEDEIEAEYEALMDEQRDIVDAADDAGRDLMGVTVTLADGRSLVVRLPSAYGRRLFDHFSAEEIHRLVSAIAQSALDPVEGPLCQTARSSP